MHLSSSLGEISVPSPLSKKPLQDLSLALPLFPLPNLPSLLSLSYVPISPIFCGPPQTHYSNLLPKDHHKYVIGSEKRGTSSKFSFLNKYIF